MGLPISFHRFKPYLPYVVPTLIAMPFLWLVFQPAAAELVILTPAGCVAAHKTGLSTQALDSGLCSIRGKTDSRLFTIIVDGVTINRNAVVARKALGQKEGS